MNYGQNIKLLALWRMSQGFDPGSSLVVEHELPDWLGEVLEGLEDGDLLKGAGHKYIRRVPKAGGKGWRYFYTVTGGHGLGSHAEMVRDASFKVKDAGQEGHFHVEEDHGEEVTLRHDESGKTARVSKAALAGMLHAEHAQALGSVRERAAKNLEQAKKTGTPKQQARLAEVVKKYGGVMGGQVDDKTWPENLKRGGKALPMGLSLNHQKYVDHEEITVKNPNDSFIYFRYMQNGDIQISTWARHPKTRTVVKSDLSHEQGQQVIDALSAGHWFDPVTMEVVQPKVKATNTLNFSRKHDNDVPSNIIVLEGAKGRKSKAWLARINAPHAKYKYDRSFLPMQNPQGYNYIKIDSLHPGVYEYNSEEYAGYLEVTPDKKARMIKKKDVDDAVGHMPVSHHEPAVADWDSDDYTFSGAPHYEPGAF